jgi:hypothetical protein
LASLTHIVVAARRFTSTIIYGGPAIVVLFLARD